MIERKKKHMKLRKTDTHACAHTNTPHLVQTFEACEEIKHSQPKSTLQPAPF